MIKRHVALLVLTALLLPAIPALAQAPAQVPATKIGVVDVNLVFHTVQETKGIEASLKAEQDAINSTAAKYNDDLKLMVEHRNQLSPDSPAYDDQTAQIEQKSGQYELELKQRKISLQRMMARQLKATYDKVQAVVSDVAKQKGLDIVITKNNAELPKDVKAENIQPDQLGAALASRNPVYLNPAVDITQAVIAAYDAKTAAGGAPVVAPPK